MAYDEALAERVRRLLAKQRRVAEKKMMGGLTFMVNGKMCVGIVGDELMCRIDPGLHESAIRKKGCRTMDFTGRPMKGYVFVCAEGMKTKIDFDFWLGMALDFNKKAKASKKMPKKRKW